MMTGAAEMPAAASGAVRVGTFQPQPPTPNCLMFQQLDRLRLIPSYANSGTSRVRFRFLSHHDSRSAVFSQQ